MSGKRYGTKSEKQKAYRERKKNLSGDKDRARQQLRDAVRHGKIIKPNICEVCGGQFEANLLHGHHSNYNRPLDVIWTCVHCHNQHHFEELAGHGENNSFSKLTEEQVIHIRSLRRQGFKLAQIADQFRISVPTACQVANSKTWKQLSGGVESRHARKALVDGQSGELVGRSVPTGTLDRSGSSAPPAQNNLPAPALADSESEEAVTGGVLLPNPKPAEVCNEARHNACKNEGLSTSIVAAGKIPLYDKKKYPNKQAWEIAVQRVERAIRYAEMFPHLIGSDDLKFQTLDWQYENEGVKAPSFVITEWCRSLNEASTGRGKSNCRARF